MKKRLTIGVIVTVMAATVSFVAAGPHTRERVAAAPLSADDIFISVQALGLVPTTRVFRRGPFYVLHALDRRGTELRIVADAGLGDILSVTPIYLPRVDAGPRIIHVPRRGARGDAYEGDEAALPGDDDVIERAPTPRHRAIRHPRRAKRPAPPAHPRRSLSRARPPAAEGLSPVYPTPKFKAPDEAARDSKRAPENDADSQASNEAEKTGAENSAEKFRAPDDQADRTRLPPPSDAPPRPPQPAPNDAPAAQD